jgi:hypothetical protein
MGKPPVNWLVISIYQVRLVLTPQLYIFQQKFLKGWTHPWPGLVTLAIMFSLPYALLMWR